ncbi:MAG: RbsD/FucU family protein [Lentisphaeria bacterium]|nr:RbsD/FucU family protein [Lentisphaeria bacterium]
MIRGGILNPHILSLLARVRHTNTLVIADRGFPSWPMVETIDISLVDGIPTVLDVLRAVLASASYGEAFMAEEFLRENDEQTVAAVRQALGNIPLTFEPHEAVFKARVPRAVGLIRTGDTIQYANMILRSA